VQQSTKGPSHTLLHENVQIDRYSAQRVIPDCTDSGFRVFSGEELHLDVDKYIRSITDTDCSNEVVLFFYSFGYLFVFIWLYMASFMSSLGQFFCYYIMNFLFMSLQYATV